MKAMVVIDIPEREKIPYPLSPFNVKVTLDYGDEVVYLGGEVRPLPIENQVDTDVVLDTYNNLMKCPCCDEILGTAYDWTPNFCCECGSVLTGGNGKAK